MDAPNHEWLWTMLMDQSLEGDLFAYQQMLCGITTRLTRSLRSRAQRIGIDVDDIVQDVMLALHLKRDSWVRGTPVAPWVMAIARNKLIDAWRRHQRRPEVTIESVAESLVVEPDERLELSRDLERGLATLTPRQRAVVMTISLEGCTSVEAAQRLAMTDVAVRVTLHRALKTLAALFSREATPGAARPYAGLDADRAAPGSRD